VTTWKRVQGDVNDTAVVDLHGIDAITGCTVVGHIWQDGVASENLTGSVTTAVATATVPCAVTIVLGGASGWLSDAAPGVWSFEQQLTFPDTSVLTWPAGGVDNIVVRAQGA
jgi:hypothetical protein